MPAALSAPVDALPPAAVIGGRYKLLKALGQGGFGITYIAWDAELARNVAVKECFPSGLCRRDPLSGAVQPLTPAAETPYLTALDDMRKEAHTLAQVEHARVLRVHDVVWGNGRVFLIMPWLGGGSLAERIADTEHLPTEEQALSWLADIVEGLAYLHGKGIIHRSTSLWTPGGIRLGVPSEITLITLKGRENSGADNKTHESLRASSAE